MKTIKVDILLVLTDELVFGLNNSSDDGYPSQFSDYIQNFVAIAPDATSIAEEYKIPVIGSYLLAPQDRSGGRILNDANVLSTMKILIHLGFKMNEECMFLTPSNIAEMIGLDLKKLEKLPPIEMIIHMKKENKITKIEAIRMTKTAAHRK
ncbi:MAG: hypothetical protein HAW62_01245 [Endozoicomonadaceae bacterium]|nr:hypothetical protein [Endozoicomonadaceae bacterium]